MSIKAGDRVLFEYSSIGDELYDGYDGQLATVVRQLEWDTEVDREQGPMYLIQFKDATEINVFEDELTVITA